MKKTVIVTGAAGNLGTAVVQRFLDSGYKVIAAVRPGFNRDYIQHLSLETVEVDLTDESDVEHLFKKAGEKHNHIHTAILLAGGFAMGSIDETSQNKLQKMLSLNFETAFNMARRAFDHFVSRKHSGRIVFIGGKPALDPSIGKDMLAYALSKSLLFDFSKMLNEAGKEHDIFSTVVVPSIIDTPVNREVMPDANFHDWVTAESLATTIEYACSKDASDLRQEVIKVYGNT